MVELAGRTDTESDPGNPIGKFGNLNSMLKFDFREEPCTAGSALDVTVLMRLFSAKAWAHEAQLRHGTVNLGFPSGRFL